MEKFDYLIMTESNQWISTGFDSTEKDLNDDIETLKEEYPDEKMVVFKAPKMERFTV